MRTVSVRPRTRYFRIVVLAGLLVLMVLLNPGSLGAVTRPDEPVLTPAPPSDAPIGGLPPSPLSSTMNTPPGAGNALLEDCASADGICLYEDSGYGGGWRRFTDIGCVVDFTAISFNDIASSIRFIGGYGGARYVATLYEHTDYGGAWTAFGGDDPDFVDNEIGHDRASSICIAAVPQCVGDGMYLYDNAYFGGRCRKFTESYPDLKKLAFDEIASSIRLVGSNGGHPYCATLCEDAGYGGACSSFTSDAGWLAEYAIGNDRTSSVKIEAVPSTSPTITDWKGEYWNNPTLSGCPVLIRNDASIDFDWWGSPGTGVPPDGFSTRWTREQDFAEGRYRFHVVADDGIRLWIDGERFINEWYPQNPTEYIAEVHLYEGTHFLKVEYYEDTGRAVAMLWWESLIFLPLVRQS